MRKAKSIQDLKDFVDGRKDLNVYCHNTLNAKEHAFIEYNDEKIPLKTLREYIEENDDDSLLRSFGE